VREQQQAPEQRELARPEPEQQAPEQRELVRPEPEQQAPVPVRPEALARVRSQ
jgi:hypothetical protein